TEMAKAILADAKMDGGWCLAIGAGSEDLARGIAGRSRMHVLILEGDIGKVAEMRKRLGRDENYGGKISVMQGTLGTALLPPYFASVVVAMDSGLIRSEDVGILHRSLHPYHGKAYLRMEESRKAEVESIIRQIDLDHASVSTVESMICLRRSGGLDGAGNWTH